MRKDESSLSILIAADHAGFALKEHLKARIIELDGKKINWIDQGPSDESRVDYPDYADRVAKEVAAQGGPGVLICGSGQGMAIRANRYRGVRAALVWNEESSRLSREHNDANIICLGARFLAFDLAEKLVRVFLATPFSGGRHQGRVDKLGRTPVDNC